MICFTSLYLHFQGPVPLANLSEGLRRYAKQLEADIDSYLQSGNKDMPSKCMIAQDILRMVRPIFLTPGRGCSPGDVEWRSGEDRKA